MSDFGLSGVDVDQNDYQGNKTETKYIRLSQGPLGCENMYWLCRPMTDIDIGSIGRAVGGYAIVIAFGIGFHDLLWDNEC